MNDAGQGRKIRGQAGWQKEKQRIQNLDGGRSWKRKKSKNKKEED